MKEQLSNRVGCTDDMHEKINLMPKVELHVHLDTCLSFHYVKQANPSISFNEFASAFIAPEKCEDLGDFLKCIEPQLDILQTKMAISLAVNDLFEQLQNDNVIYVELRFAPLLHLRKGLKSAEVVEVVLDAMEQAKEKYAIEARLILCTLRHFTEQQSLETAQLVIDYQGRNVVALDLAADEARFTLSNHQAAFDYVRSCGGHVIAHAGEALGYESVLETLDKLKVSRIGHGVRSIESDEIIERLKLNKILLEVCPSCNITCNVFDSIQVHPVNELKKRGVRLNINTDARTVANTTLNQEYQLLHKVFNWTIDDFIQCNVHALEASFLNDIVREQLTNKIKNWL
ncbi:adenosine deaminase [Providencia huaxiensis]|nr:adenosine deaminase [Providencia huaxiensis]